MSPIISKSKFFWHEAKKTAKFSLSIPFFWTSFPIFTCTNIFGLKFFNKPGEYNVPKEVLQKVRKKQAKEAQAKKTITQPTTFQEEGVLKKVRFPNKKMEDAFKANVKLYYSFPQGSSEAKKAGATLDSFKNFYPDGVSDEVLRRHVYFYKDKLNLNFGFKKEERLR